MKKTIVILSFLVLSASIIYAAFDTDGGLNYPVPGICTDDNNVTYSDTCLSNTTLLEYYPFGSSCSAKFVKCHTLNLTWSCQVGTGGVGYCG